MELGINPIILVLVGLTLLLPVGVAILILGRRRIAFITLGLVLILVSILACVVMAPVYVWKIDALRGWKLCLSTDVPPYVVSLIQEPGDDSYEYESYLEITRPDGKKATVWIDHDDFRWWNPQVAAKDGRIYFTRDFGTINERTTYVDIANDTIFSGYYQRACRISELEFGGAQKE